MHIGLSALLLINIGVSALNLEKNQENGSFSLTEDIEIIKTTQEYFINLNLESEIYTTNKESLNDLKEQINVINKIFEKNEFDKELISTGSFSTQAKYDYSNGKSEEIGKYSTVSLKIDADSNEIKNEIVNILSEVNSKRLSVNPKSNKLTEKDLNKSRKELIQIIKNKAENIAKSGGFKIGKIKNYYEDINNRTPIMFSRVSDSAIEDSDESAIEIPESKETSKLSVTIEFYIK